MALKKYYIGSLGPYYYDDAVALGDPDGDFVGEDHHALVTDGQLKVQTTPTDNQHVVRLEDLSAPWFFFDIENWNAGGSMGIDDFRKTLVVDSTSNRVISLPAALTSSELGEWVVVVRIGSGRLTVMAPAGTVIANSSSGGGIKVKADGRDYSWLMLWAVTTTKYLIGWGHGVWYTF